ncbi:Vacuolar ATP synthase subunit G 2 family protein [Populus alba x Populus x berolinensis]|nr:Vacuolar ATP synthase subunit G 2 family protein [Populus alba x Populus x berolinensis]
MSSLFIKLIALNDLQQSDCIVRQDGFKKLCILFIGIISKKCLQQLLFYFSPLSFGLHIHNEDIAKALSLLEDKPILHGAILTTNQDFESLKTFNNKNLRKPPLTDDKMCKLLAPEYTAAATMIKGEAILAKVDATLETMLAEKYNVLEFPSSYFFVDGVRMDNHYLERTRLPRRTLLRWSNAIAIEVKTWMAFEVSMNNMRKKFLVGSLPFLFANHAFLFSSMWDSIKRKNLGQNVDQADRRNKEAQAKYDEDRQRWQEERKDLTASQSKSEVQARFHFSSLFCTALEISRSMEANRGQNGIQLLLAAEQEAQHIVNAARNDIPCHYTFFAGGFIAVSVDENELKEAQAKYDEDRQRWQEERKDLTASQSKSEISATSLATSLHVFPDHTAPTALEISRSMEANRGQNGIQLLLAAEQEAQHIVNAARNGKHVLPSLCFW